MAWHGAVQEATWEPAENISNDLLDEYEAGLEAEAELDAEEARELAEEEAAELAEEEAAEASSASPMDTSV